MFKGEESIKPGLGILLLDWLKWNVCSTACSWMASSQKDWYFSWLGSDVYAQLSREDTCIVGKIPI